MENVVTTSKRVFSAAIAAATIAFTIGAGALLSPAKAQAATAGMDYKASLSTVYYYGFDGLRYTYPNEDAWFSWHDDFDDVVTISDTELASMTLGGNVVIRPGTWWIKVQSNPKVYAVARDGSIHWIESEEAAMDFAGPDWNARIRDVADVFFADYTEGTSLMSATAYEGMLYDMGGSTYLVWDGEMRMVTSAGMSANGLDSMFILDGDNIDDSALMAGDDVTGEETALVDVAQTEEGGEEVAAGDVVISESSSTPAGMTLPGRTNAVDLFHFDVAAGDDDAELDSVTLSMIGAGATSNIANVYLYHGDERLTEARSVNASTRQVTFSNLAFMVDANDEETLSVKAEISVSQTAGDEIGFEIESDTDVVASGDVSGSFPITGNTFSMSGSDAGWIEVDKTGSIVDPTLGEQDAVIGQFKLTTNSEAADVQMVTLKIDNATDHSDFWLWDGSTALAEGDWVSGDLVMFDLSDSPFAIDEGSSNVFSVSADIGGQDADTVKVFVDNRVDVVAEGGDFGFGMCIDTGSTSCTSSAAVGSYDGSSCTSAAGSCSFSTVKGGELTLVGNGPSTGDIMVNGKDEVLLNFSITAAQDLTIKDLDIIVYGDDDADNDPFDSVDDGTDSDTDGLVTGTEQSITDIKIINVDSGAVVMGPLELDNVTDDDEQTIDFTDDFSLMAGESMNLAVTVDVDNSVGTGTEFGATVDISGLVAEDANGDTLSSSTDIVPTGDIVGFAQEANAASLVIALASTPGDVTTVDGTDNVHVQSFTFTAGDGGDVLVNSIQLSVYADEDNAGAFTLGDVSGADVNDFVESCTLKDSNDVVLDGPESAISTGLTIDFNDVDWTVPSGENYTLKVVCSFGNPSDGTDDNFFAFDLDDLSEDVVAEDEDGNDVDPTTDDPNGGTSPTNVVSVNDAGSLTMAADSSTPSPDFILTSSTDVKVSTFRFTATNENFDVNILTFSEEAAEDDTGTANSSSYANNISTVKIDFPKADGTTGSKSVSMTGNEAKFSDLDMYVKTGTPGIVNVYVTTPLTDRDSGGNARSNEEIRMGLFADTTNDDNFQAVGAGSGTTLDDDDATVVGDDAYATDGIAQFVVRETKPTISLNSSSPTGAKVPGDQEVFRFNIAASSNEDVIFKNILFKISATDNTGTPTLWENCDTDADATSMNDEDFDFYNMSEQGTALALDVDADWTGLTATGADCTTASTDLAWQRLSLTTEEVVPKGQTYMYALWVDLSLASAANDDTFQVEMATDPIVADASFLAADELAEDNVTGTDTILSMGAASTYALGDVLCMDTADNGCGSDDEKMLVVVDGGTTLTVVRGYLATTPDTGSLNDTGDNVDRVPGAFLWQDDGVTSIGSFTLSDGSTSTGAQERYGAHLVDNLPVTGNSLVF